MKRHGSLFDEIVSLENIELAYCKARRNKTWQKKVKRIDRRREKYLACLHDKLVAGTYYTSPYNIFRQKAHGFNRGMNATCM